MKLIELFCGTGGFSSGAHHAGFAVAAAYDIDATLTSSYPLNFPNTKLRLRDISELTGAEIEEDVGGPVFGVFGGPPCQGFSDIGKRDPRDPRRSLLLDFFRIVSELQPSFFVMENVKGLTHSGSRSVLDAGLGIVRSDYDIDEPATWDAADFGAATKRKRLLVIGVRKDLQHPFSNDRLVSRFQPATTVSDAISDVSTAVQQPPRDGFEAFDTWLIPERKRASKYAISLRAPDRSFTGHRKTKHSASVESRFRDLAPGAIDKVGRHHRLDLKGLCPTLRAGTGADLGSFQSVRPIHPTEPRVITVREAARLQGFPDDHLFHPTVWHSFRMIGNSVSPIMARAVFEALAEHFASPVSLPGSLDQDSSKQADPNASSQSCLR